MDWVWWSGLGAAWLLIVVNVVQLRRNRRKGRELDRAMTSVCKAVDTWGQETSTNPRICRMVPPCRR